MLWKVTQGPVASRQVNSHMYQFFVVQTLLLNLNKGAYILPVAGQKSGRRSLESEAETTRQKEREGEKEEGTMR